MKFSKEFKEAINHLPSKKKNKLILRLLKKDLTLANRLHFELLNDKTIEEQRKVIKKRLTYQIEKATEQFYSVGYLNMDVRYMSGEINEHVSITKDKFGEVSLNLYIINEILEKNKKHILSVTPGKARKFCVAVIARAFKILLLINKLHEDYFVEFEENLKKLGELISENPYLMEEAINNGLDINWLIFGEMPDDIIEIHKEIRQNGFLK